MSKKNGKGPLLQVRDLHVSIDNNEILRGLDLAVDLGEVHAIMGPNGSGKSTLANVLAGRPGYSVTKGDVRYEGKNLLKMPPDERARAGVFLAFQYPVELPGIRNREFLRFHLFNRFLRLLHDGAGDDTYIGSLAADGDTLVDEVVDYYKIQ